MQENAGQADGGGGAGISWGMEKQGFGDRNTSAFNCLDRAPRTRWPSILSPHMIVACLRVLYKRRGILVFCIIEPYSAAAGLQKIKNKKLHEDIDIINSPVLIFPFRVKSFIFHMNPSGPHRSILCSSFSVSCKSNRHLFPTFSLRSSVRSKFAGSDIPLLVHKSALYQGSGPPQTLDFRVKTASLQCSLRGGSEG